MNFLKLTKSDWIVVEEAFYRSSQRKSSGCRPRCSSAAHRSTHTRTAQQHKRNTLQTHENGRREARFGAWPGQSAALRGLPSHATPAHFGWHDRQLRRAVATTPHRGSTHAMSETIHFVSAARNYRPVAGTSGADDEPVRTRRRRRRAHVALRRASVHVDTKQTKRIVTVIPKKENNACLRINALRAAVILIELGNHLRDTRRPHYSERHTTSVSAKSSNRTHQRTWFVAAQRGRAVDASARHFARRAALVDRHHRRGCVNAVEYQHPRKIDHSSKK